MKYQLLISLLLCFLAFSITTVFAKTSTSSVNATVQISVCGNGVIEGGEDCEETNLNGKTCASLGYGGGVLSCDISCSFDISNCIAPTPTPTPLPTTAPVSAVTHTQSTIPPTATPTIVITKQPIIPKAIQPIVILPPALQIFANPNGTIAQTHLHSTLAIWVSGWKQTTRNPSKNKKQQAIIQSTCDINHDSICDVKDLSLLLYYIR